MKVNRRSDNRGATLILDEQELEYLWHKLNCADSASFESYKNDYNVPKIDSYDFFNQFNKKYTPPDEQ